MYIYCINRDEDTERVRGKKKKNMIDDLEEMKYEKKKKENVINNFIVLIWFLYFGVWVHKSQDVCEDVNQRRKE